MALKVTTRQLPKGTVHVHLRGPAPEPPASGERVEVALAPDSSFDAKIDGVERLRLGGEITDGRLAIRPASFTTAAASSP